MERWAPSLAPERERPRRRAGQPSFSSTLLDAICDAMDEQPGGTGTTAARTAGAAKKRQEAALHYYYYKPALAASHREAPAPGPAAEECAGRGYFSSSEVEYSHRRLRPIRTSAAGCGGGAVTVAPSEGKRRQQLATEKARRARKPAAASARMPAASPGARLASLLNAIFSGKRHSARQHPAPAEEEEEEPACSTAPSCARAGLAKTPPPPPSARARGSRGRSRTVRFLDIDGEVAVAAAAMGYRQIPVVEVEEVLFRPAGVGVGPDDSDGGEESSDTSSDLFELENLAAVDPASDGEGGHRRACGDELPVYGSTRVGHRDDVGRRRPFGYGSLGRKYSRAV